MVDFKPTFTTRGRRVGLITAREQGLDLEAWDNRSRLCWSMGVICTDADHQGPAKIVGIPEVRGWLLVLPTYLCTTRFIQLPSGRPEEIAAMLEFEVPLLVPHSSQPWTWDFCVTGRGQDGTSQVLVILSPLSIVESAMERVRALGIEPCLVTVSAALNTMRLTHGKDTGAAGLCGYAWWDYSYLDFFVMDGTRLMFLRGVRVCGQNSQALSYVEAEVSRSVSMFRERGICDVELPLHVGGTRPEVPLLIERLGRLASVSAHQVRDPITCDAARVRDRTAETFGLGSWCKLTAGLTCVNLFPRHRKEKNRRALHRRELLGLGLRACCVALLVLLCLRISVWRKTRLLQQYHQRLAQIAPLAQKLQFLQGQLNMIQNQVQGSVSMLDILGQLYELLPRDVTIHYLSIDQNQQVVVRAQAKWLSQAFDCIDPLEQSRYLANVRQSYAHLREFEGQVLIDFELRADLEKRSPKEAQP